jgi:hypothetical protein
MYIYILFFVFVFFLFCCFDDATEKRSDAEKGKEKGRIKRKEEWHSLIESSFSVNYVIKATPRLQRMKNKIEASLNGLVELDVKRISRSTIRITALQTKARDRKN